ncbi:E3 ubiquitin-protein ligase SH3RF1 [Toxorhynchites rutilus septentrionalis]|uniref:E3 ubiquitin-protein ligase SH3RF1 n=1 Tax=Toxorhynchites rutilus septentrionalis TaxID=329112 RepID=UPI002478E24C|nr:E3 ubiquitin-protein ligase SH3RF1 [Toxorhynchites rutilus septentrionalis]XP_055624847.1 E3 ubiquitin-protein ligase SH3RF1 [Toxorhynchites rutilus septentrionalis]
MDERLLNDLLECSVCLDRLDTSSKVLPCQHTFCRKCLEEIVASHQELRCPECRVLVDVKIDELPPNVLLMRILEGMKTAELNNQNTNINKAIRTGLGGGSSNIFSLQQQHHHQQQQQQQHNHPSIAYQHQGSSHQQNHAKNNKTDQQQPHHHHHHSHNHHQNNQQQGQQHGLGRIIAPLSGNNALDLSKVPHAKAFYDFSSGETSDISFKKGDIIILRKKIDHNWCVGEVNGKEGAVPLNHLQVIVPLPYPQCKALYDFSMGPNEEEGCLTFKKGSLIHVLRRVDQNWAEGRIGDKIGIFPISFVEMNSLGKQLMDSALKHLLANAPNNRSVPPTPFDLNASDTTSSSATTSPNSSASTTSSNSSTAPSSPTSHFLTTPAAATSAHSNKDHKEKRHSLTNFIASSSGNGVGSVGGSLHQPNRHSAEILNIPESDRQQPLSQAVVNSANATASTDHPPTNRPDVLNYQKSNIAKANQLYHPHPQLPATYIALYPYKPQKHDELELKKGSIYYVTERCQDGWFKGANRQQKSGVFPGNYVTVYKGRDGGHSSRNPNPQGPTTTTGTVQSPSNSIAQITLPALPPRDTTTAPAPSAAGPLWTKQQSQSGNYIDSLFGRKSGGASAVDKNVSANAGAAAAAASAAADSSQPVAQPVKEKKDSSAVSLMKRLTNIKRSKSPTTGTNNGGTTNPAYSMDNPVFEDSAATATPVVKQNLQQMINPVHVRSGSCPSQLLQNLPADLLLSQGRDSVPYMYGSQRVKPHKERPSMQGLKHEASGKSSSKHSAGNQQQQQSHEAPVSTSSSSHGPKQSQAYHRKSQSLDASAIISHMNGTPSKSKSHSQTVRERFKCIVPYPPNSEYELELRVGDIVLVHKKRDNGWYKGTHQRSGKTGLFPASFVEPDI